MKLGVLFSGGKDSTYALHLASEFHDVVCLIVMAPQRDDSYMFHHPNIDATELQARSLGLPRIVQTTAAEKESELGDMKRAIERAIEEQGIEGIVTGAVGSTYQASRVQRIAAKLDLWCFNPLWQMNQVTLLRELLEKGYRVHVSAIAAFPLDETWLGRVLEEGMISELINLQERYGINPAGEGGELETFVSQAPMFEKEVIVDRWVKTYANHAGVWKIEEAHLA